VPTQQQIVFERFFDESGGMQLVIHSPFGARINRAWGLAMRKRFCRSFDFELQASADNNGIVLSLGPQHSFPLEQMFRMLNPTNGPQLLKQAMLAVPMFQVRFRWNATRALAVLRQRGGKRVPPPLQRFRADDFLASVFPAQVACLENVVGDIEIPDHPLVNQTVHDCLHEAMDVHRWVEVLAGIQSGAIELVPRDTREPSPFSYELLNAYPYAFLDDAPLEERRARAVATRRTHSISDVRDLGHLDQDVIRQVRAEAWPLVRDAEELHEALLLFGTLPAEEGFEWTVYFEHLLKSKRATRVETQEGRHFWAAAERWPLAHVLHPGAVAKPPITLPDSIKQDYSVDEAALAVVRGRLECSGPVTASFLAERLELPETKVAGALATLEVEGYLLQGRFSEDATEVEWCERRLLARIHRMTLDGARRQIKPVEPADFLRFLVEHHHLTEKKQLTGRDGVKEVIAQLQGFQASAGAWEYDLLPGRVSDYEPAYLDELTLFGEVAWGRLAPPVRGEDYVPSGSGMSRVVPIALVLRSDLAWLLPAGRVSAEELARAKAQGVLEALSSHGAVFFNDLRTLTGLLSAELDDALSELAALGLVTADGFAAIRAIVSPDYRRFPYQRRRKISRAATGATRAGRWSKFPGSAGPLFAEEPIPEDRIERWARLLLARYGVLFRDLLSRENVAPSWREMAAVCRRLEARGDIRGGRFVSGVAGEQFAIPGAVERLRQIRDEAPDDRIYVISAADPLNLAGVLFEGPRIPATRGNTLAIQNGRFIAARQAGKVRAFVSLPPDRVEELADALRMTGPVRQRDDELRTGQDKHLRRWTGRRPGGR
jgi:ATP-dependent Lhr-like helicase